MLIKTEPTEDTKALILGYDLANDVGIIQAVDQGIGWKNIAIAPTDGRVGIGVTSPNYKLHVGGTGRFTGALTFSGADGGFGSRLPWLAILVPRLSVDCCVIEL